MVTYHAMLDVPRELVVFVAELLATNRRARGTRRRTRKLSCWAQALFVLVWFRERRDVTLAGQGFGISRATAYRYRDEAIEVLAAAAPRLVEARQRVADQGWSHVILDGKIVDADRCATKTVSVKGKVIDAWFVGKTRDVGGNIQGVARPDGFPIWVGDVEPGSVHDITAAREHALPACYAAASQLGLPTLADPGYEGAGAGVYTPVKQPADGGELDVDTRTYNMLLRSMRSLGERGFALLTERWRTLGHVTASPRKIGRKSRLQLSYSPTSNTATSLAEKTSLFQHLNRKLVRWAMRKYKRLRRRERRATRWLADIARREPTLFAHWRFGVRP